jgi:hypothetical protein
MTRMTAGPMPKAASSLSIATCAGLLFLVIQASIGLTQSLAPDRKIYFTAYSGQTSFRLNVTLDERPLTTAQIRERYHLPFRGRSDLTPEGLQAIIIHHESVYAKGSDVFVRMHFSRQRGPEEVWLWPQQ